MMGNLLDKYGAKLSFYQISHIAMTFHAHIIKTGERTLCFGRIAWRDLYIAGVKTENGAVLVFTDHWSVYLQYLDRVADVKKQRIMLYKLF